MIEDVLRDEYYLFTIFFLPRGFFLWGFFMAATDDIKFIKMAIKLSKKGYGFVNPNPLVGAVIVKKEKIIGKGYHEYFGGPHAEVNAIKNAKESVRGATIYVTLEPCNHYGKTPPCTEKIIKEGFTRVVIGMEDPNRLVSGKGIKKLKEAGIEVKQGILENEIRKLNEVYIKFITTNKPFCVLKTAMTLDGKISTYTGDSKWITNSKSRKFVHELRHRYSAIVVGVNTVIKDDPELTDRSNHQNKKHPLRVVVDSNGRTPLKAKVLNAKIAKTIIAVTKNAGNDFINSVKEKECDVLICPEKENKVDLKFLFAELSKLNIDSVLIEGGGTLNFSTLQENLIDKVYSFISPKIVGGENSKTPVGGLGIKSINDSINLNIENIKRFEEDILIEAYI